MRCKACNAQLSDQESTRKGLDGEYMDLCNRCHKEIAEDLTNIYQGASVEKIEKLIREGGDL